MAVNLDALRENGQLWNCLTIQIDAEWPVPKLRPVIDV
jgi:hypothetical protein